MNKHIEEERGNICKERGPHTSLRIPNYYGITSMVTFSILKEGNKKKGDDKTRTILKKNLISTIQQLHQQVNFTNKLRQL